MAVSGLLMGVYMCVGVHMFICIYMCVFVLYKPCPTSDIISDRRCDATGCSVHSLTSTKPSTSKAKKMKISRQLITTTLHPSLPPSSSYPHKTSNTPLVPSNAVILPPSAFASP
jgi:hypothetical protein